jgi:tetratricopeptide (TPR) repeat protein
LDKHIDVLGYLLTALVFSVGFLSARVHSTYDATVQQVSELSWRVRGLIKSDQQLGPTDLTTLLAFVRRSGDQVATASRLVNLGILLASAIVFGDGVWLLIDDVEGAPHALELLIVVLLSSVAVSVIGEVDLRRVRIDQRDAIDTSTLGRLEALATSIHDRKWSLAQAQLTALRDSYPEWGLLIELEAFICLREGDPEGGLARIQQLVAQSDDLYVSAPVGVACALAHGDTKAAAELLDAVAVRAPSASHVAELRQALALTRGDPAALFEELDTQQLRGARARASRQGLELTSQLLEAETAAVGGVHSPFAIRPEDLEQTAALLRLRNAWHSQVPTDEVSTLSQGTPLHLMLMLLLPAEVDPLDVEAATQRVLASEEAGSIEALAFVQLVLGDAREAMRSFERAVALRPRSAYAHWGMALGCLRVGWTDEALKHLRRANTAELRRPIVDLTRRVAEGGRLPAFAEVAPMFPHGIGRVERVELAILGIEVPAPPEDGTPQDRFVAAFVEAAVTAAAGVGSAR